MTILGEILDHKRREVEEAKKLSAFRHKLHHTVSEVKSLLAEPHEEDPQETASVPEPVDTDRLFWHLVVTREWTTLTIIYFI